MDLTCPSCTAQYRVPEGAIGENGRQVSCTNCGHGWHAMPEFTGDPDVTGNARGDIEEPSPPPTSSSATSEADDTAPAVPPRRDDPTRREQLAEIREMLAEVQAEELTTTAAAVDEHPSTARPRQLHDGHAREGAVGPFLTGFLLIVMLGAVAAALYVLEPQIVARLPDTEPVLTRYVEAVDELRLWLASSYEFAVGWLTTLIDETL